MNDAMLRNLTLDEMECQLRVTEQDSPAHLAVCKALDAMEEGNPDAKAMSRILADIESDAHDLREELATRARDIKRELESFSADACGVADRISAVQHSLRI